MKTQNVRLISAIIDGSQISNEFNTKRLHGLKEI